VFCGWKHSGDFCGHKHGQDEFRLLMAGKRWILWIEGNRFSRIGAGHAAEDFLLGARFFAGP